MGFDSEGNYRSALPGSFTIHPLIQTASTTATATATGGITMEGNVMTGTRRRVAIVGTSDTSRQLAPFDDPSWEIWVLGSACGPLTNVRIDRIFEIHADAQIEGADERAFLRGNTTIPVYMQECADWVPMATEYPTEAIIKEFGRYFTNSISYMIALALYEGVDEIGVWGVDMAAGSEYAAQRPSCEYMIGIARGRGIDVFIPEVSDLLKCAELYGAETSALAVNMEARYNKLNEQLAQIRASKTEAMLNEAKIMGAMEILSYVKATWTYGGGTSQ